MPLRRKRTVPVYTQDDSSSSDESSTSVSIRGAITGTVKKHKKASWAALVGFILIVGACWYIWGYVFDNDARFWQTVWQGLWIETFFPNGWNIFQASWFAYVIFGLLMLAFGLLKKKGVVVVLGAVIALINATIFPMWWNNMLPPASLSAGTIVTTEDFNNPPPMLRELIAKSEKVDETTMRSDVRGYTTTITQAPINLQWEARPASAKGAELVMRSSGDTDTNSILLGDTISYHSNGTWSAIRDGWNAQGIAGVAVWNGVSDNVTTCRFSGANELNYAFNGLWGRNLMDLVVSRYSNLLIDTKDMWGDCDAKNAPMVVIPTTVREGYGQIRSPRFGGVIVVKGSPTGEPITELITNIEPGQFTGPVYPSTLASQQRESFDFAAGILSNSNAGFGTEVSKVPSQMANPSEYLLKSKVDGRMYWVTPVRPNRGESELIIGYTVIEADSARVGTLNGNHLYFFGLDDVRTVDLSRLYAATQDAVNIAQASFFNSGGSLTEMLPVSNGLWQAFAERGGRVVYRIDISTNAGVVAKVATIGPPQVEGSQLVCTDPTQLEKPQLRQCIDKFLDELQNRK